MIKSGKKLKISIVGAGNMGAAILEGVYKKYQVSVCESDVRRRQYLKRKYKVTICDLKAAVEKSRIIILAVKPQSFSQLLKEISEFEELNINSKLFVSIAAGITTSFIEKRLGSRVRVIRTMPNLPAQIKQGMTAVCMGKNAKKTDLAAACNIFKTVGNTVVVEEKLMDAVTAVSGSGPAYVFLFIECLVNAARSLGLNERVSNKLVVQTLKGSLNLFENSKEAAGALRAKVTSKGGTTQAALEVLTKNKIDKIFKTALGAAKKRAKELSR